jgi:nucleotide-binding universal stress UspA family protein
VVVEENKRMTGINGAQPGADIAAYLDRHGVEVSLSQQPRDGSRVSDVLLAKLADSGAGLLCMGAYGHTRLRERVFGGMTYDMLHAVPIPTLIAC